MTFFSLCACVTLCDPSVTRHTHQTPPIECDRVTHPLGRVTLGHALGWIQEKAKNGSSVTRFLKGTK